MPLIGTSTDWLTPAKRALKRTNSLPSSSCATARAATLSTTRPSFTALRGTFTPAAVASTRMYGVNPLSLIQSYIARSRYGRLEDMLMLFMEFFMRPRSGGAKGFFVRRQTAGESGIAENAFTVIADHMRFARQRHAETGQAPHERRECAIGQTQLRVEKELRRLEQRNT